MESRKEKERRVKQHVANERKKKARKFITFVNDEDGFTARDFLLSGSFIFYVGFWATGLIRDIMGVPVSPTYLDLLEQMRSIVFTIVTGVFAVSGVQMGVDAYRSKYNHHEKPTDYYNNDDEVKY